METASFRYDNGRTHKKSKDFSVAAGRSMKANSLRLADHPLEPQSFRPRIPYFDCSGHLSDYATYQELSPHARSADSTCWITLRRAYSSQSTRTIRTLEPSNAARQPSRHLADAETPREHRGLS